MGSYIICCVAIGIQIVLLEYLLLIIEKTLIADATTLQQCRDDFRSLVNQPPDLSHGQLRLTEYTLISYSTKPLRDKTCGFCGFPLNRECFPASALDVVLMQT